MKFEQPARENSVSTRGFGKFAIGAVGFLLSGLTLWLVFRDIEVPKLLTMTDRIRFVPLLGALALYWGFMVLIRAAFIGYLLRPVGRIGLNKAYRYICIGYLANDVLPFRMGEVIRIGGIAGVSGIRFPSVVGSLAIERLLDMTMMIVLFMVATQVAPLPSGVRTVIMATGSLLVATVIVFTFLARRDLREIQQQKENRLKTLIWNFFVRFTIGLKRFSTSREILVAVGFSAVIWGFAIAVMMFRLMAFDLEPSIPVGLVLLASIALGVSLPSAPGYVGVYHAFAAGALILFGVDEEVAVGFAIFSHAADIIPSVVFGIVSMVLEGLGWADLKRKPG
ncbi:MAG: flippase-like domain-containing protein [Proteobacteria bacterium]|nr:flippase-like domain-containing protein [Pseudomonadota bacterium]